MTSSPEQLPPPPPAPPPPPLRWRGKRKDQPTRQRTSPVTVLAVLVSVGLLIAFAGALGVSYFTKDTLWTLIVDWRVTQTQQSDLYAGTAEALRQTAESLQLTSTIQAALFQQTQRALDSTAQANAQHEIDLAATNAALLNRQDRVEQAETQQALNIQATQTAVALSNAQEATQVSLDYANTQAALNEQATQIELNYQATRAALDHKSASSDQLVAPQSAVPPPTATVTPSPAPTLTLSPSPRPTASPTSTITPSPTQTPVGMVDDNFAEGLRAADWGFPPDTRHWYQADDGVLTAGGQGGWLLSRRADLRNYTYEVWFTPLFDLPAEYYLLLNVASTSDQNVAIRLKHTGRIVTEIGVFTFKGYPFMSGIVPDELTPVATFPVNLPASYLYVRIEAHGDTFSISLNSGEPAVVQVKGASAQGGVGLQVPVGTRIQHIRIMPLT